MDFLTRPITSERLEEKGQSLYKTGKLFCFIGFCGFALLLLSVLITLAIDSSWVLDLLMLDISEEYAFMFLIIPLSYLGILLGIVGIPMYFNGLTVFALGRIAHNTEEK